MKSYACNMHVTCMLLALHVCLSEHACNMNVTHVGRAHIERFRMNIYLTYLAYALSFDMCQTWYM